VQTRQTYEDALAFHRLGRREEVERVCRRLLVGDARHVGALRLLANVAYTSGRGLEAVELLSRAARAAPQDAQVQGELGLVLTRLDRHAEAVSPLRTALELDPTSIIAHDGLGIALRELGQLEEAEAAHRKALQLDPRYHFAHEGLGELALRRGRLEEARACFESALALVGHSPAAHSGLGDVLTDLGEYVAAIEHYREAIRHLPNPGAAYTRLGNALQASGDGVAAVEAHRMAVTHDPRNPRPYIHLARTLLRLGQPREALERVEEALRLQPADAPALGLKATALAAAGELEAGVEVLQALASRLPGGMTGATIRGNCLGNLGSELLHVGSFARALECFRLKLELEPYDPVTLHRIAALTGVHPERCSDEYIKNVFDAYADKFDRSLLEQLRYSVPRELKLALLATAHRSDRWDVLDLGCGTGLVGVELAAHASSLVGVDLSPKMLERTRERQVYSRLVCAELVQVLEEEAPASYDVITAGDVFIYFGNLDPLVAGARRVLREDGMLAFNTEAAEDVGDGDAGPSGYRLEVKGRYVHAADYLKALAARHGFEIRLLRKVHTRLEDGRPVMGWLTVWSAVQVE
jgi:predicted TPR repeat methyltransferase